MRCRYFRSYCANLFPLSLVVSLRWIFLSLIFPPNGMARSCPSEAPPPHMRRRALCLGLCVPVLSLPASLMGLFSRTHRPLQINFLCVFSSFKKKRNSLCSVHISLSLSGGRRCDARPLRRGLFFPSFIPSLSLQGSVRPPLSLGGISGARVCAHAQEAAAAAALAATRDARTARAHAKKAQSQKET